MKSTLNLRPVYPSKDDRIRSHVLLCWLALLMIRIAEVEIGASWKKIRSEVQRLHLVGFFNINVKKSVNENLSKGVKINLTSKA